MENAPVISLVGRNVPSDIEDRFNKWRDEVYAPGLVKSVGYLGIDGYEIIKKVIEYPNLVTFHHGKNRDFFEQSMKHPLRQDIGKDQDTTFYRVVRVWHDVYTLVESFRIDSSSRESTIVENAPIIHLEGYKVPTAEQGKYEQWFMRWASRVYIPMLIKSPGLKAYNCFKLSDLSPRNPNRKYLETEIPSYLSVLYFENMESFENYEVCPEYAAFKRSLEFDFPSGLNKVWDVEYQLRKSWRK